MEEEKKSSYFTFKTHILLPVEFIFSMSLALCFLLVEDFTADLSKFVVWFYEAIAIAYTILAIVDLYKSTDKSDKKKMFIAIMCVLNFIASILYAVFYFIGQ